MQRRSSRKLAVNQKNAKKSRRNAKTEQQENAKTEQQDAHVTVLPSAALLSVASASDQSFVGMLTISVLLLSGRMIVSSVHVRPEQVIADVVTMASDALGAPCMLCSPGFHVFANTSTIAECGLEDGAVITAIGLSLPRICTSKDAHAFAALRVDGSVITFGNAQCGGDSSAVKEQLVAGVQQVIANENALQL
jgi:hypothetical protein